MDDQIEIAFDDEQLGLSNSQGWMYITWDQAHDLARRLDVVLRYHDMYMQAD